MRLEKSWDAWNAGGSSKRWNDKIYDLNPFRALFSGSEKRQRLARTINPIPIGTGSPVSWRTEFVDATIKVPSHACPLIRQDKPVNFLDGVLHRAASRRESSACRRYSSALDGSGMIVRHPDTTVLCNGFCGSLFPLKMRLQPYTHIYICEQLVIPHRRLLKARGAKGGPRGSCGQPLRGSFPQFEKQRQNFRLSVLLLRERAGEVGVLWGSRGTSISQTDLSESKRAPHCEVPLTSRER
jgi:hypothetical protein